MVKPTYLTTAQIAAAWDASPRTVHRWVKDGLFIEGRDFLRGPYITSGLRWKAAALPENRKSVLRPAPLKRRKA